MLLVYLVLAVAVWEFKFYEMEIAVVFGNLVASVIPSLHETAAISKDKDFARFILAVAWTYIPITWLIVTWRTDWMSASKKWRTHRDGLPNKKSYFSIVMALVFLLCVLFAFMYIVPTQSGGRINRIFFYGIRDSNVFLVIFGCGLWATWSVILSSITLVIHAGFFYKSKGKK